MCSVVLTDELAKQVEFVAFNIAFSKESGKFTAQEIANDLNDLQLQVTHNKVKNIIDSWLDNGLIFENLGSYVVYS